MVIIKNKSFWNLLLIDILKLLILPIQRLPRYTLLLKELLKYTQEDHRDYPALSEAFDKMKDVATSVNEVIKQLFR